MAQGEADGASLSAGVFVTDPAFSDASTLPGGHASTLPPPPPPPLPLLQMLPGSPIHLLIQPLHNPITP